MDGIRWHVVTHEKTVTEVYVVPWPPQGEDAANLETDPSYSDALDYGVYLGDVILDNDSNTSGPHATEEEARQAAEQEGIDIREE